MTWVRAVIIAVIITVVIGALVALAIAGFNDALIPP